MMVDDSKIMRNTLKGIFNQIGIVSMFVEAGDGKEALRLLDEYSVDLILLDWNMPQLNGLEFLKQVRAKDKYKNLPIIMVTSEAERFNIIEALKYGATDYISKPVTGEVFREKLTKIHML